MDRRKIEQMIRVTWIVTLVLAVVWLSALLIGGGAVLLRVMSWS